MSSFTVSPIATGAKCDETIGLPEDKIPLIGATAKKQKGANRISTPDQRTARHARHQSINDSSPSFWLQPAAALHPHLRRRRHHKMSRPFLHLSRRLCTMSPAPSMPPPAPPAAPALSALPAAQRREACRVSALIRDARVASAAASADMSDEDERVSARVLTKHALARYVALVAQGNPPVTLSKHASRVEDDSGEQDGDIAFLQMLEPRNDVMKVLGEDVHQMKMDVFRSNRQRVWIGWRGWF